jgi:hypothetical protein
MKTVSKLRVMHLYLIRNGYSEAADILWLMYIHNCNRAHLIDWLTNGSNIYYLLNQYLFVFGGINIIEVKAGFKSLKKLMAVLPKRINQ